MEQMPEGTPNGGIIDFQDWIPGYHHYVIPRSKKIHM